MTRRNVVYSKGEPKCIYCCMPCIGCFLACEKLLQSIFVGILWTLSCGGICCKNKRKQRQRKVIPLRKK